MCCGEENEKTRRNHIVYVPGMHWRQSIILSDFAILDVLILSEYNLLTDTRSCSVLCHSFGRRRDCSTKGKFSSVEKRKEKTGRETRGLYTAHLRCQFHIESVRSEFIHDMDYIFAVFEPNRWVTYPASIDPCF
jgi:hypothetical protein